MGLKAIKLLLFLLCLVPADLLLWQALHHGLGPNPVERIEHQTGLWALRLLLLTLAVTPLRRLSGWHWPVRLRRMLGLYVFFYGCLHFSAYMVFDHFFDLHEIIKDVVKRPYITFGFAGLVLLIPLAATSTNRMLRRLGGARWQRLHALVYPVAALTVLHYLWLVKADLRQPLIYAAILAALLGYRLYHAAGMRRSPAAAAAASARLRRPA